MMYQARRRVEEGWLYIVKVPAALTEQRQEVLSGNRHLWSHTQSAAQMARFGPAPLVPNVRRVRPRSSEPRGVNKDRTYFLQNQNTAFEQMMQAQSRPMTEQVNMLQEALASQNNVLMQFMQNQQQQLHGAIVLTAPPPTPAPQDQHLRPSRS